MLYEVITFDGFGRRLGQLDVGFHDVIIARERHGAKRKKKEDLNRFLNSKRYWSAPSKRSMMPSNKN